MSFRVDPARDRAFLAGFGGIERVRRGAVVLRCGEPSTTLILVRSGHLKMETPAEDHPGSEERSGPNSRVVEVVAPWEVAGEESLLPDAIRPFTLRAGEGTTLQRGETEALAALRRSRRTFTSFLRGREREVARLRGARAMVGRPAEVRLSGVLLELAARAGEMEGQGVRIPFRPTHETLGDMAGLHRSTVTTLLNGWEYGGVIQVGRRGVVIRRPDRLAAWDGRAEGGTGDDVLSR